MTDRAESTLLDHLTRRYASLKLMLTRRLGNAELASDALHDTYVRLRNMQATPEREQPDAYLMRVATNIAVDMQRKTRHTASGRDIDAVLDAMADPSPGPAREVQARFDLDVVTRIIDGMPKRRRLVVVLVHWERLSRQEAADRLGVSRSTVDTELQRAHVRLMEYFRVEGK